MKQASGGDPLKVHKIRPDFADTSSPPKHTVLTNHFKVDLTKTRLHKYFISVKLSEDDVSDGQDAPRGKRLDRMAWFMDHCDFPKTAKRHFASDGLAIIASWKELGDLSRGTPSAVDEILDNQKRVIRDAEELEDGKTLDELSVRYILSYHGEISLNDLINACNGTIARPPIPDNLGVAIQALNIVLSEAT